MADLNIQINESDKNNKISVGKPKNDDRPLNGNELFTRWKTNQNSLPAEFHRLLDPTLPESQRGDFFEAEDETTMDSYAWAIPDDRALKAVKACAPIVEMGAGAGYWARLLRDEGVEVKAFDKDVGGDARAAGVAVEPFTRVEKGGPEVLGDYTESSLLLIYPDDLESTAMDEDEVMEEEFGCLSLASLAAYKGNTIIHVGEWLGDTLTLSMEGQGTPDFHHPWGRSTNPQFQIQLNATFHKVLQLPLPNWGSVRNCLTVWKRTVTCVAGEDLYAFIPPNERLDLEMSSPSMRHLL